MTKAQHQATKEVRWAQQPHLKCSQSPGLFFQDWTPEMTPCSDLLCRIPHHQSQTTSPSPCSQMTSPPMSMLSIPSCSHTTTIPIYSMADPHSTCSSKLPKATTLGSGLDQASPLSSSELPKLHSIPELIADESVSVLDVNSILFVINELSLPDKARALMAALMPIWLATQLPAADRDCEYFHNGLAAICRFCDFPPAGYDPRPYTAVSPVPPGTILPPGLSPTRVTNNCDMDTDSDGGPPAAPAVPMIVPARASTKHLRTPTPQPERKGKMKEAPPHLTIKPAPAPKAAPPTPSAP